MVLDILINFVEHFEKTLNKEEHPLTERIFEILKQLLATQSDAFLSDLYSSLAYIVGKVLLDYRLSHVLLDEKKLICSQNHIVLPRADVRYPQALQYNQL